MKKEVKWIVIGVAIALLIIVGLIVAAVINSNNYENFIQKKKAKNPTEYEFFPDSLPDDSNEWSKEDVPTILQGSGYLAVTVKCSDDYIDSVINEYEGKAIKGFFGKTMDNVSVDGPYIVTDKGQMFVSPRYDENDSYKHPMYEFNYKVDNVSNIGFYDSFNGLDRKFGVINSDLYDVRSVECSHARKYDREGVIVYILQDNDNWNHRHQSLIFVDRQNKTVEYYAE